MYMKSDWDLYWIVLEVTTFFFIYMTGYLHKISHLLILVYMYIILSRLTKTTSIV